MKYQVYGRVEQNQPADHRESLSRPFIERPYRVPLATAKRIMSVIKSGITYFQHKYKIIDSVRPITTVDIARLHGYLQILDHQSSLQWATSHFEGGLQDTYGVGHLK